MNAANYLFWLSELRPVIDETDDNHDVGPTNYSEIELDRVEFSYPLRSETQVLRGVNLAVSSWLLQSN